VKSLLLFLLALAAAGRAEAGRGVLQTMCEERMARQSSVVSSRLNGYSINNTLSYRELAARAIGKPAPGTFVLGLTTTRAGSTIQHSSKLMRNPFSGYECVSSKVETTLFYEPAVIYIGREIAPGTCAYEEILAHEMRHLKTYFDQLPKVESVVRAALKARFDVRAVYAPQGEVEAALKREFDEVWIPFFTKELSKVERLQALIDTPEEYARLSRVCKGKVQSLIRYDAGANR